MKLTKREVAKLKKFITKYSEIQQQTDLMQQSIISLANKRDSLFSELEEIKEDEKIFMKTIIDKYGPAECTPNKLLKYLK